MQKNGISNEFHSLDLNICPEEGGERREAELPTHVSAAVMARKWTWECPSITTRPPFQAPPRPSRPGPVSHPYFQEMLVVSTQNLDGDECILLDLMVYGQPVGTRSMNVNNTQ